MSLKIGVIGPTNIANMCAVMNLSEDFFLSRARVVGKIIAEADHELWVNSDGGMLVATAKAYKDTGGKKLVVLYPEKGEPWPNDHAMPYIKDADEVRQEKDWFWCNYNVVSLVNVVICLGLSAGTFSELAYIKWNYQFKRSNLMMLIGMRELLRERQFPCEIEVDIEDLVEYVETAEELKDIYKIPQ